MGRFRGHLPSQSPKRGYEHRDTHNRPRPTREVCVVREVETQRVCKLHMISILVDSHGRGSKLMVPSWGRCTTHFSILVGIGYSLKVRGFDS